MKADTMVRFLALSLLAPGCGDEPTAHTNVAKIKPAFVKAPLTGEAVFMGPAGGIVEQILGLDEKYFEKGTDYGLDLTLEELHVTGQDFFLGSQTVLLANTTLLSDLGQQVFVSVTWEETEAIDNGSLIRACAQIVKVKEGKPDRPVSDVVCEELEPTFPD